MVTSVLTLKQLMDLYHILDIRYVESSSADVSSFPYSIYCMDEVGKTFTYRFSGCDFFGARLYSLEDDSYKEGFIYE